MEHALWLLGRAGLLKGIGEPPNMLAMCGHGPGVHQDVINVYQHKMIEVLPEHLMHEIREYRGALTRPYSMTQYL